MLTDRSQRQAALSRERDRLLGEVAQQAAARQRYIDRQNALIQVSTVVLGQSSVQGLLQAVADAARELGGAALAISGHGYVSGTYRVGAASSARGEAVCPPGQEFLVERGGVHMDLIYERESIRLSDEEMRRHPRWWGLPPAHGPLRGLLGARMVDREGRPNGLIMLTDKEQGDFTAEGEIVRMNQAAQRTLGVGLEWARLSPEDRKTIVSPAVALFRLGALLLTACGSPGEPSSEPTHTAAHRDVGPRAHLAVPAQACYNGRKTG